MSAFVVDHAHIDALLTFADAKRMKSRLSHAASSSEPLGWTDIGRILLAENERSVCHRYPDCTPDNCPGKIGEEAVGYTFKPFQPFVLMDFAKKCTWIIKNCDCFDYQACETDDYRQSIACAMISAIRSEAIRMLPHYDAAPWGIQR